MALLKTRLTYSVILDDFIAMRITAENFEEKKHFIGCFLDILIFLTDGGETLFGGVVRDLIAPLSRISGGGMMEKFRAGVEKYGYLDINDIDVSVDHLDPSAEHVRRGEPLLELKNFGWEVKLLNSQEEKDPVQGEEKEAARERVYATKSFQVRSKNHMTKSESIKIDFVVHGGSHTKIDFDVNNLTWRKGAGFGLAFSHNHSDVHEDFAMSWTHVKYKKIDSIIDSILERKCMYMASFWKSPKCVRDARVTKMVNKGFVIKQELEITRCTTVKLYNTVSFAPHENDNCAICIEDITLGEMKVVVFSETPCKRVLLLQKQFKIGK